jgi:hypothetical protein
VRFILAAEDCGVPLVLCRPQSTDRGAELLDFSAILGPISRALRGYRAIVVRLRLSQKLRARA